MQPGQRTEIAAIKR